VAPPKWKVVYILLAPLRFLTFPPAFTRYGARQRRCIAFAQTYHDTI